MALYDRRIFSMNHTRTQILTVKHHCRYYGVVKRNVAAWEPPFVVVAEGSGAPANSVAHFFNQDDAEDYAQWKNRKIRENG